MEKTMMNKKLSIIVPVSQYENPHLIEKSIVAFSLIDYSGFDETIIYAIDDGRSRDDYRHIEVPDNVVLLFVYNNTLKQAGGYNAGLDYDMANYFAFFDIDATPASDFFQKCAEVDTDFVTCERCISNPNIDNVTKTVSKEYEFCNLVRQRLSKFIGKYHPASCTGLVRGKVFEKFRFTEKTGADLELYMRILKNRFTMGYANTTYWELSPTKLEDLRSQRVRWFSDAYRMCNELMCVGTWKENMVNFAMMMVAIFPLLTLPFSVLYIKHIKGYNSISHIMYMQYLTLVALCRVLRGEEVAWDVTKK